MKPTPSAHMTSPHVPPPRVLLVEDDPISRAFMTAAVQGLPAEIDSADSLAAALALANAQDYALWLLDAHLPDGSGVELLTRLRVRHPHTPALAHTASDDPAVRDALITAGFLEVLIKPLPAAAVNNAVQRALGLGDSITHPSMDEVVDTPPLWDDEAAASALNGNRMHIATLRGLFVQELPQLRERISVAAQSGNLECVRASLHKLCASCGFVGASRLGAATRALHQQADSPSLLTRFDQAAQDTLTELPSPQDVSLSD